MSLFIPRVAFAPVRCAPVRHEVAPLWSLFDETLSHIERASRHSRKQFNPRFNVSEAKDTYFVEGELPGFNPKDLSIEFLDDGHTLQIKGRTASQASSQPQQQAAVEAVPAEQEPTTSESASVKSHQASVEDEAEEQPANASAVSAETTAALAEAQQQQTQTQTQAVQQQNPKEPEHKQWISERYSGEFSRSFKFPSRVNQEAVKASLKDGILSITLPFAEKLESRRISIE